MKKKLLSLLLVPTMLAATLTVCASAEKSSDTAAVFNAAIKPATQSTMEVNRQVYNFLNFEDTSELENAERGFIAAPDTLNLRGENGRIVWTQDAYAFLDKDAPDTANPSLWRNTQLNHIYGLFEVTDGIYQVRGYDISNITFVRSEHGWIIMDCGSSKYTAAEALKLFRSKMGDARIVAIVISHAHVDHYGGIEGLIAPEDSSLPLDEQIASGKTAIIVPKGFTDAVMKENVFVGTAMKRRAFFQYGSMLPYGEQGRLSVGIGLTAVQTGVGYIAPTFEVADSIYETTIDGVTAIFQQTPGTESPAEMNTYFPDSKALWMAENCSGSMHNLYTLRGAEVRDGAAWASYITEAISLYGKEAEVTFQSHNWPHWGNNVVNDYMVNTAAVYKFINDQTLTYINQGYTSDEISNMIELPEALNKIWYTRQYYGTVAHNAKAVYQKFMGWYDSNPVNLNPLTPSDSAKKWVEYLGDVDKVLQMAKADFDKGEYQWVAEVTNTIVFADPTNTDARLLCADALEQLGYQAESGPWRNEYLTAAQELRHGNANFTASTKSTGDMVKALSAPMLFDYMAIVMDKQALADRDFTMNVILPDVGEQHMLRVKNGVLLVYADTLSDDADVSITCPKNALFAILTNNQETVAKAVKVEGSAELLTLMMENMNQFPITGANPFHIIEP